MHISHCLLNAGNKRITPQSLWNWLFNLWIESADLTL